MRYRAELEAIYKKHEMEKIRVIVDIIKNEHKSIDLQRSTLTEYLKKIRREGIVVTELVLDDSWTVVSDDFGVNTYNWITRGESQSYSVEFIDNLFTYYSRKGYNFTRNKAQLKFGLTPKAWTRISQQFQLSKDCDILSPYTLQNTAKDDLADLIESRINTLLSSGEMTAQKYDDAVSRKHRKIIESSNLKTVWENSVITDLLEQLPGVETIKLPVTESSKIDDLVVGITDFHAGAKYTGSLISEDYSLSVFKTKLRNSVKLTNDREAKNVHLVIAGDIVECINLMHENQFKGLEEEGYGVGIVFQTYEILVEEVFNKINNLSSISLVSGNHDRDTPNNKNMNSAAVDILVYLLKQQFSLSKSSVIVNYHPDLVSFDLPGFGVITAHGHKGLHKREGSFLTENFAKDRNKFQFILTGHYHSFACKSGDDSYNHRKITMPSIVTANLYSDLDIGRSARSGVTFLYLNSIGQPSMTIENL